MILSNNNGTFTPVAGGTGTFIGTTAAFNAVKATLPENTVAYITDDGNGDLQPVDAVTNGDMHPVTSNAVYDSLKTKLNVSNGEGTSVVMNRVNDGIVSLTIYDSTNSGLSIDFNYTVGYIVLYKVQNGTVVGSKSVALA